MRITSFKENKNIEKRIAITPEIAKKYISNGFEIILSENYGNHLGYNDEEYKSLGVQIANEEKEIINNSDIIVQLGLPSDEKLSLLNENQNLVGILNPYINKDKIEGLIKKKNKLFFLRIITKNNSSAINGYSFISS